MKKFVQRFVPEYERILGMESFVDHVINRRFLFANGALLSVLGFTILTLVGWIFQLLENRSYLFYGYNIIFIIVLFLLVYSTEVQRQQHTNLKYSIWVMIISRCFSVLDGMVVMWSLMFVVFNIPLFSGLEGTIYNVVVLLYLLCSIGLRRQVKSVFIGLPLTLLMGAMLLFFISLPMIVQYGLSLVVVSLLLYLKHNVGLSLFTTRTVGWLVFASAFLVFLLTQMRENDIIVEGFEPYGNTVLELSSEQSFIDTNILVQYFGYSFSIQLEEDGTHSVVIYNQQFILLKTIHLNTTEDVWLDINFQDDTVLVYYASSDSDYELQVYEIDTSLELVDSGLMDGFAISDLSSTYEIQGQGVDGYVIFQNLEYVITDPGETSNLNIYKRLDSSYEYLGTITKEIFLGGYGGSKVRTLHMINDVFVFGRIQNNELILYVADTSGHMLGGTDMDNCQYRGRETYFSNAISYSSRDGIGGIYFQEDGTPMISSTQYGSSTVLFEVKTLYRPNLDVGWTLKNNTEIASILLLCGLLLPISSKEEK